MFIYIYFLKKNYKNFYITKQSSQGDKEIKKQNPTTTLNDR